VKQLDPEAMITPDPSKIPPFLMSPTFGILVLRIRIVALSLFFIPGGLLVLGVILWMGLIQGAPIMESTAGDIASEIFGKILILSFIIGWNVLVWYTLRHDLRMLKNLKSTAPPNPP
jgi:hypothetical protein